MDLTGDLEVTEDGALTVQTEMGTSRGTHDLDPRPGRGGERIGDGKLGRAHRRVPAL